jgi:hypothetical protein
LGHTPLEGCLIIDGHIVGGFMESLDDGLEVAEAFLLILWGYIACDGTGSLLI